MTGHISAWLLQVYLLLLMVRPLDPSSQLKQGPSGLHAKELGDMDPELTPGLSVNMALLVGTCFLVELLVAAIALRYYRRRRLQKGRKEEKQPSPSAPAGQDCCQEHNHTCPTKLIRLLRHNRAMLRMCLQHCSQQRGKAKRAAAGALWKRRRFRVSPQH